MRPAWSRSAAGDLEAAGLFELIALSLDQCHDAVSVTNEQLAIGGNDACGTAARNATLPFDFAGHQIGALRNAFVAARAKVTKNVIAD